MGGLPSRRIALLAGGAMALFGASPGRAAQAPVLGAVALQRPPDPYNETEDAQAAINAAKARARKSGKAVLIDMGGNWCVDCLVLSAVMRLPKASAFIDQHFEVVAVDVGQFNKNLQIPARYGIKMKEVPCVVILDRHGKPLNAGHELALGSASTLGPQAVLDQLAAWLPN